MQATTLRKLSELLGISISTVSRALKNHPDVSQKTKERVWELSQMMDYEPNSYAINLRTNNSHVLGVIVPEISNYFYDSLISSIEEQARQNGYSLLILQSGDDPQVELANLKLCKQNRVAGIFISVTKLTKDVSKFLKVAEDGIPLIFLDKVPLEKNCNKICMDDAEAATIAADALWRQDKKNILAIFGNKEMSITKERRIAFADFFKGKDKTVKVNMIEANNPVEAYQKTIRAYSLVKKPDAVFCMSDEILTGVMKGLIKLQIKYPSETGIIAISNGLIPKMYYPEITYVETSGNKLGKLAYTRMMASLAGSSFIQNLKVEALLVEGASL